MKIYNNNKNIIIIIVVVIVCLIAHSYKLFKLVNFYSIFSYYYLHVL